MKLNAGRLFKCTACKGTSCVVRIRYNYQDDAPSVYIDMIRSERNCISVDTRYLRELTTEELLEI